MGPAVGRFLASLVMMTKAKRIFELGSAIGYSTIRLTVGIHPGVYVKRGQVIAYMGSPALAPLARISKSLSMAGG